MRLDADSMKDVEENSSPTLYVVWWKKAGWRVVLLLTSMALFSGWLLVDWRRPTFQLQAWINVSKSSIYGEGEEEFRWQCYLAAQRILQERGSLILHNWSDNELVERAVEAEDRKLLLGNSFEETRSMNYLQPSTRCRTAGEKPKIAFLFLTAKGLPLAPLWEKFFEGNEGFFNIYIHGNPDWLRDSGFDKRAGLFWGRVVPSANTHRSDPDIVQAERRLLANALLDDPMNEWFALVSEACIPVRNFGYMYQILNATENSFIDCGRGPPGSFMKSRYSARGETAMLPEVPLSEFRLGSQWFVIRRRHAVMIVRDQKYWPHFRIKCLRMGNCAPDEHYVQTVIGNLDEPACHNTATFISWNGSRGGHPQSFGIEDTTPHLIEAVKTQQNSRFLFARKFRPEALQPLLNMTNLLFRN